MSKQPRVAVIGGGRNPEHDVSLAGAAAVAAALERQGHPVLQVTIDRDGRWSLDRVQNPRTVTPADSLAAVLPVLAGCDAVFPVLHGEHGEDGTVAALADLAGLALVGCGLRAGALAADKHATKAVAAAIGIGVADGVLLLAGDDQQVELPPPLVVKPTTAGSSYGVTLVHRSDQLETAVQVARRFGDAVLVEQFVENREVHVGVVELPGGQLSVTPALEFVKPHSSVFDTGRKYGGGLIARVPAPMPVETAAVVTEMSARLFRVLGCAGLSRFDYFLTPDGAVLLNEINTMPGMTEHSSFPKACAAAGMPYDELVTLLVRTATQRQR